MYGIDEIESQNRHSNWAAMFLSLSRCIVDTCGRSGEGAIREAARALGAFHGDSARKRLVAARIPANLVAVFGGESDPFSDPRFRVNVIRHDEQVFLCEVYTCPFADAWKEAGGRDLGHLYCEEYYHAVVRAFTKGKGQVNLSKSLTHQGDNHCRFSLYFRPANLDVSQRAECFLEGSARPSSERDNPAERIREDAESAKRALTEKWLLTYLCIHDAAVAHFGAEGSCAVALGLRRLAQESIGFLRVKADATGMRMGREFLLENLPVPPGVEESDFWKPEGRRAAKALLDDNFTAKLEEALCSR